MTKPEDFGKTGQISDFRCQAVADANSQALRFGTTVCVC